MQEQSEQHKATIFFTTVIVTYLLPVALFWVTSLLPPNEFSKYLFTTIGSLVTLAIALFAIRNDTVRLGRIGWSQKGLQLAVKVIAVGWVIWAMLIISVNFKMGYPFSENFESPLPKILVQWLFVGIAEEVLFRGYIFTKLTQFFARTGRVWSKVAGVVISSLIFATFHIPQRVFMHGMELTPDALIRQMFPLFLAGVLLAWLFLRSQNVLLVGLFHGGMNAPLIGREGDLAPILLFLVLVEIFAWRRRKQASVSEMGNLFGQGEA
ncbi:MAG: CPBP family intramembrane metalloprotease [Anaerolineales bacterium]|nr:CPBP family intramembrane metalloprotease [Anaerolineales bacterium]